MASRMFRPASSMVSPVEKHPGRSGTQALYFVPGECSITTAYCIFSVSLVGLLEGSLSRRSIPWFAQELKKDDKQDYCYPENQRDIPNHWSFQLRTSRLGLHRTSSSEQVLR